MSIYTFSGRTGCNRIFGMKYENAFDFTKSGTNVV